MAYLAEINPARSNAERKAHQFLAEALPDSWVVTTNVYEHNFEGRHKPEIDCIVLCPFGLFVLDFKNWKGDILPRANADWGGSYVGEQERSNPMVGAANDVYPVKDLLRARLGNSVVGEIWIDSLIVFTNEDAKLDWSQSDLNREARLKIVTLGEVEARIKGISQRRLSAANASAVLGALKPAQPVPSEILAGWAVDATSTPDVLPLQVDSRGAAPVVARAKETKVAELAATGSVSVDFLVDTMFPNDSRRAAYFADYLEYRGRSALARKKCNEDLSDDEVDYLHYAKRDFSNRLTWADKVMRSIRSLDVDLLMESDPGFGGFQGMLPRKRTAELLEEYVFKMFMNQPSAELNVLINAHEERMEALTSDEFKSHTRIKDELEEKLSDLGMAVPQIFESFELCFQNRYQRQQERLRRRRAARGWRSPQNTVVPLLGDLFPGAPWSAKAKVAKLRNEIEQWSEARIAHVLSSNLKTISRVIGSKMADDVEFKRRISREALGGDGERDFPRSFPETR